MASVYTNDLRLEEIGSGEQSGTWGDTTNTNLELIAEGLSYGTEGITTNANTHTSTVADGATDPARSMYIEYTGTLDSACTITIAPNTLSRMHFIENGTSGSQNIIIKQGSGATITIPPGDTKAVYLDGAGSGAAVVDAFASLSVVDLKVQDDLTVTDDMTVGGTLGVTGVLTATSLDISGDIDVDGTTNLDAVDIDGAVNMATTALVTGVLTTTAAAVFNGGFTSNGDTVTFASANAEDPLLIIKNTTNDTNPSRIRFVKDKGAAGADGDDIGTIEFFSDNDAQEQTRFALIRAEVSDASDAAEGGKLRIQVATHDGEMQSGLIIVDGSTEDEIDVTIANGTASLTTIAGLLASKSHVVTGTDNNAFEVKTNHSGNPSALRVAGSGSINGIAGSFQNFFPLNVMKDSGSGSSIYAAGNIKSDGNVSLAGNVVISTSGKGIDFSAGAASASTSNLLDEYEEGTFSMSTVTSNYTLSINSGFYTKIGRSVTINYLFSFSAVASANSQVVLSGCPFNTANFVSGTCQTGVVRENTNTGAIYVVNIQNSNSNLELNSMDGVGTNQQRTIRTNEVYCATLTYQSA